MIPATLVTGATPALREAAIRAAMTSTVDTAIILEGIPDAQSGLDADAPHLHIVRIAPGCVCCTGNLTMRVTLNRLLRGKPEQLYIGLATSAHLEQIRAFLTAPPYDNLLALTKDLHA
ncbi:GTPase [Noviherbaspirillum denitrificans]|uniref:GTPase n=1 Tax=Noviherbaspirillum denitrificans TaxID=1968433 RepID=A0A254TQG0_9BURK|nr:GTPase [Noviherbaspirillum denitrificans]OWW21968.1 GTPase [Noviherbaspirillum denitrificans]